MDISVLLALLGIFFLGSYIQTVTGFAFGLIVMGLTSVWGLVSLPFAAFVTSLLSLLNTSLALRGYTHRVYRPALIAMLCTAIPLTGVGLWLLERFSDDDVRLLKLILGGVIIASCLLMMVKPKPRSGVSTRWSFAGAGALAGVIGGLFSTYGPPMAYLMYRQPLPLLEIRLTLLMTFAVTSVVRLVMAAPFITFSPDLGLTALLGFPVVVAGTLIGKRYGPPFPEIWMRRLAFALLIASGTGLVVSGLNQAV